MNNVLTREQAKQVTGGRTPLLPLEYETACTALEACTTLDEAKYWDNKADALAAWAKIYHNDEAASAARRVKLHAYRRLGELALELKPKKPDGRGTKGRIVKGEGAKGAKSLLKESGMKQVHAEQALFLATQPRKRFDDAIKQERPPTPATFYVTSTKKRSDAWDSLYRGVNGYGMMRILEFIRNNDAASVVARLSPDECAKAKALAVEINEWFDELERCASSRTDNGGAVQ